jgi:hypothetical protein
VTRYFSEGDRRLGLAAEVFAAAYHPPGTGGAKEGQTKTGQAKVKATSNERNNDKKGTKMNLQSIATKVKKAHAAVLGAMRTSLQHAIEAGGLLSQVHGEKPWSDFVAWVKKSVGISEATAANYLRLYRHRKKLRLTGQTASEALNSLRVSRKPKAKAVVRPPQTAWEGVVWEAMGKYHVKGKLDDVTLFLESFGVEEGTPSKAA